MNQQCPYPGRPDLEYPVLRSVEVQPFDQNGEQMVCLRDSTNIAAHVLVLPPLAFFMATFMNGKYSVKDIQAQVTKQFGFEVPLDRIWDIVNTLDKELFLESQPFVAAYQAVVDAYHADPYRKPFHAGQSYENDPVLLKQQLAAFNNHIPFSGTSVKQKQVKLLIVPHIDIHQGGDCYASGYRSIRESRPSDLYIILGTAHQSRSSFLSLTKKSYNTPLGVVETDVDFVEEFSRNVPMDVYEEELLHRTEHSIEFQAVWLRHTLGEHWRGKVMPILCGSFQSFIETGKLPSEDKNLAASLEILRSMILQYPGQVTLIAGVDFSHVGKRFGDDEGIPLPVLTRVEKEDQDVIKSILTGKADVFFKTVYKNRDRNNLCGLSPIYMALHVGCPSPGQILQYAQSVEDDTESMVSYASIVFHDE